MPDCTRPSPAVSAAEQQFLDIVYHAELGLDAHIDTIYAENDMDPVTLDVSDAGLRDAAGGPGQDALPGRLSGTMTAERPDAVVLLEQGHTDRRIVYDEDRVEARRVEREREALAQRYVEYAAQTSNPATFEQFVAVIRSARG